MNKNLIYTDTERRGDYKTKLNFVKLENNLADKRYCPECFNSHKIPVKNTECCFWLIDIFPRKSLEIVISLTYKTNKT